MRNDAFVAEDISEIETKTKPFIEIVIPGCTMLLKHKTCPHPDTLTAVGICHACKQIGHFPSYLKVSRFGGSGTGRLVKLPWLASFCHH